MLKANNQNLGFAYGMNMTFNGWGSQGTDLIRFNATKYCKSGGKTYNQAYVRGGKDLNKTNKKIVQLGKEKGSATTSN